MDLVDEQERALPLRTAHARGVEDLLQFRDAGMDRGELHECVVAASADEPRDRRLAAARRPPEDHRAERRRGKQARQRSVRSRQVLLAGNLGNRHRPQPFGERRRRRLRLGIEAIEKAHIALSRAARPAVQPGALPLVGCLRVAHCSPLLEIQEPSDEFLRPFLRSVRNAGLYSRKARAAHDNHGSPGLGEKGSRRLHADRPPRKGRLSGLCRRIAPRRAANDQGRDLPHLFDDQADRFGRGDDAGRGGTAPDHRSRLEIHPRLREREGRRRQRRQARSCAAQARRSPSRTSCATPRG